MTTSLKRLGLAFFLAQEQTLEALELSDLPAKDSPKYAEFVRLRATDFAALKRLDLPELTRRFAQRLSEREDAKCPEVLAGQEFDRSLVGQR